MSERLENMNANEINAVLVGIISKASSALVYDDEDNQPKALQEIAEELSEALGTSRKDKGAFFTPTEDVPLMFPEPVDEPTGYSKFLTVADGVTLMRFAGPDFVKLVAKRKGHDGCKDCVFEIAVDKPDNFASVSRDGNMLFRIIGMKSRKGIIEQLAVSSLHRYLKLNRQANKRKHLNRKRRRMNKGIEK